ncbi:MAG: glycoside hydrolase family 127 protein [Firmicutes bacterium]|nr:glycoside hydrolase family 127 protein [Bacillota bacterium]
MLKNAKITGNFWQNFMELIRTQVVPYQWEALNDRVENAEPSYCMHNFHVAGGKKQGKHGGLVFQDSDLAKWLEAVAYVLEWHHDPLLEQIADTAIDDIVAAQQPDGYLNTYYILNGLEKRFTNLKDNHELYCLGHFLEAAVAYYRTTGKDKLLKALVKYVDLVDSLIGAEDGKIHGYPGHQELELALIKLYEITKDKKHLNLAKYFVDERGKTPLFFAEESEKNGNHNHWQHSVFQYGYYQANQPVREQQTAVGHSVRALYMYSGMADVAQQTADKSLMQACLRLWKDVTTRQMYITGGVGSSEYGESFTFGYDLPNDTVYAETCASIALAFFARRMFEYDGYKSEYTDVLEQTLYNGIISGMATDGKSFFYVNPLEVVPKASEKNQLKHHVKSRRQKWFGCACCPPNLARIVSSLANYAYTQNGDTLYINLFAESEVKTQLNSGNLAFNITTDYPWDGTISIEILESTPQAVLAVRKPGWCDKFSVIVNEKTCENPMQNGYLLFENLEKGDKIVITLQMSVLLIEANANVRENIGKVAVMRGPIVYCLEETDNGADLHQIFLEKNADFSLFSLNHDKNFFGGATLLESPAKKLENDNSKLYQKAQSYKFSDINTKWIPYYLWANREEGEMLCWVHSL